MDQEIKYRYVFRITLPTSYDEIKLQRYRRRALNAVVISRDMLLLWQDKFLEMIRR